MKNINLYFFTCVKFILSQLYLEGTLHFITYYVDSYVIYYCFILTYYTYLLMHCSICMINLCFSNKLFYLQNRWTAERHKRTYRTIGILTLWTRTQQRDNGIWGDHSVWDSSFGEMVQRCQQDILILRRASHDTATQRGLHRPVWWVSRNFIIDIYI